MPQTHNPRSEFQPETLFASLTWFDHWLAAFGGPRSGYWPRQPTTPPRIAYVIQDKRVGPIGLRVALAAANSHTPRFDVIGQVTPTSQQLEQMMTDLSVSVLVFPYLAPTSQLIAWTMSETRPFRWQRTFCEEAPFINCAGNWQDYLESRGQTRRTSWQKYERRLSRLGAVFEVMKSWDEISPCLPEVLQIEASGWKGREGSSIVQDPATRRFYEGICNNLAQTGKLRLFLFRRNGQIIAFQLATLHAGTLTGLKASYLDEFAKESPGQALQFWITRWAFAEQDVQTYDLLGPSSEYKLRFSTGSERLETLYVFAHNLAGVIAWLRWSAAPRLRHLWRPILAKKTVLRGQIG